MIKIIFNKIIEPKILIIITICNFIYCAYSALNPPPLETTCNFMSRSNEIISWKENLPITLELSNNVPEEFKLSITIASQQWNNKFNKEIFIIKESNLSVGSLRDGRNTISWISDEAFRPSEQARTTVTWRDKVINEADVFINSKKFQFLPFGALLEPSTYGQSINNKVDLTSLMVHELGHVLGLQHIDSTPSVMAPTLNYASERITPSKEDLKSIYCAYNI